MSNLLTVVVTWNGKETVMLYEIRHNKDNLAKII